MIMKKKVYSKPLLEVTYIDNMISLVMMTNEFTPPDKPTIPLPPGAAQSQTQDGGVKLNGSSQLDNNPFE